MSDGHPSTPSVRPVDPESRAPAAGESSFPDFEGAPLTRSEYISALVHFYRGELERAGDWRARLDPTTNWAVITTGAMLSFHVAGHTGRNVDEVRGLEEQMDHWKN